MNLMTLLRAAHERFRVRVSGVDPRSRARIGDAARALGRELEPLDFAKSVAMRELAELLEPPRAASPAARPPDSAREPPTDRYAMPPDMEGDEYLLARSPRAIRRPTEGDPR